MQDPRPSRLLQGEVMKRISDSSLMPLANVIQLEINCMKIALGKLKRSKPLLLSATK
jgi:hypothetical protein